MILNEAGNLSCGSGGGEGAGKSDDDGLAALGKFRQGNHLGRAEALVQVDCGDAISDLDHGSQCGSKHEFVAADTAPFSFDLFCAISV